MNIGYIYAISAAVTWGLVYTIDQKVLVSFSPISLLFIDSIITAILVLPLLVLDNGSVRKIVETSALNWTLIILSVILAALANFFIFSGIKHLNASTASVIEIAYPFFVVLFSYVFFRTSLNLYFLIGALLIFAGSVVIIKFA